MLRFGIDEIPEADWAWSIRKGQDGGQGKHDDCVCGFHEFVWMQQVWEYVCFFCLYVEEFSSDDESLDSEDDGWVVCPKVIDGRMMDDDLEPKSDSDSQNDDDE